MADKGMDCEHGDVEKMMWVEVTILIKSLSWKVVNVSDFIIGFSKSHTIITN